VFWVISVYFNIRNTLPKFGTFLVGHPVYSSDTTLWFHIREFYYTVPLFNLASFLSTTTTAAVPVPTHYHTIIKLLPLPLPPSPLLLYYYYYWGLGWHSG
jgi:hypothetical protein